MRLAAVALVLVAGVAHAECDKLAITDAKALTQEQFKGRICRDMDVRNAAVDSANSFLTHSDMIYTVNGLRFVSRRNAGFYQAWLAELQKGAVCSAAYKTNAETYRDLYAGDPGCEQPRAAERLELGP